MEMKENLSEEPTKEPEYYIDCKVCKYKGPPLSAQYPVQTPFMVWEDIEIPEMSLAHTAIKPTITARYAAFDVCPKCGVLQRVHRGET